MDWDKYNYNLSVFITWIHENYNKAREVKCGLYVQAEQNSYYRYSMYYDGDQIVAGQINNIHGIFDAYIGDDTFVDIFHDRIVFAGSGTYYNVLDCTYFQDEPTEEELFQFSTIHEIPIINTIVLLDLIRIAKKLDPEDL